MERLSNQTWSTLTLSMTVLLIEMEGGLIVLAAALLLFLSPDVQGTAHLSFSNNTQVGVFSLQSSECK